MRHTIEARVTPATLEKHMLLCGASGSGKSALLLGCLHSLVATTRKKRDASIILIEPHADLAAKLMAARVVDDDRLVYISTTIAREIGSNERLLPAFNPFQIPASAKGDEGFKNTLATQLSRTIAELIEGASSFGGITVNMEMLLRPAILLTLSTDKPSFSVLKDLFTPSTNESLLELGRTYPHPQIAAFFQNTFTHKSYEPTRMAILAKLNWFLNDITAFDVLNGEGADIEACMDEGKVIILNAPTGSNPFIASMLGRLLISYVFCCAMRRESKPMHLRKRCYLAIDELATFESSAITQLLQESRKYRVSVILSGQSIKALSVPVKAAITTNTYLKCLSISDGETRRLFAAEMRLRSEVLAKVEPLSFMVSKNDGRSLPFLIRIRFLSDRLFLDKEEVQKRLAYLIKHSGVYRIVNHNNEVPASHTSPAPPRTNPKAPEPQATPKPKKQTDSLFDGKPPAFSS